MNISYRVHGAGQEAVLTTTGRPSIIYRAWSWGRWYELPLLTYWEKLEPPDIFLDIGAHVGNHTVWGALAWPQTRIVAFEPDPLCYHFLMENLEQNGCYKVVTYNKAAWDGFTDLTLAVHPTEEGARGVDDGGTIQVLGVPVQQVLKDTQFLGRGRFLIKIDTESILGPVIRGMEQILVDHKCHLFVEAKEETDKEELVSLIEPLGYNLTGKWWGATPLYEATKEDT